MSNHPTPTTAPVPAGFADLLDVTSCFVRHIDGQQVILSDVAADARGIWGSTDAGSRVYIPMTAVAMLRVTGVAPADPTADLF